MKQFLLICACFVFGAGVVRAQDPIGLNALRALDATLTGSGVILVQVESAPSPLQFEVNPGSPGQPIKLFTWRSTAGMSGTFPNTVGSESGHSDVVAEDLYGENTGIAPGLRHVVNYETDYFYPSVILARQELTARVFNQSFEFGNHDAQQDQEYDNYIAAFDTVVVSGIGDGGPVLSPSDCYNGLGVAAIGGGSSTGPSADGRCKPDITAPATETSFSTPLVAGAAAILIQGGRRLGPETAAATNSRTVKALLLNGAVKPSGWTHTTTSPLDPNYGAGVMNIYNSYEELTGLRHGPAKAELSGTEHTPLTSGTTLDVQRGWDYRSIISGARLDGVNHYRIMASGTGDLITTLVWNKGYGEKQINQLQLYVYDGSGDLLGSSVSTVDNVQHVWLTNLAAGLYEIEVVKIAGSAGSIGVVGGREIYSLAWDFER
jgi:hypothetical protein